EHRDYGDKIADQIDGEVHAIIQRAYNTTRKILTANKEKLKQLAQELMTHETLDEPDLNRIFEGLAPQATPG
ncbi:MAG: cell division protein FtsH, partial [Dehalococcoidia bacterium]